LLGPVAGAVQPPDISAGLGAGQRMEHRQHRRRTHSCAQQKDRRVGRPQDKGAPRRSNVLAIASPYSVVDELTAYALRLALYADSIRARARGSGKGIAAQDRLPALVGRQAQRQKLSWLGRWHASAVRIGEVDRDHGFAF